MTELNYIYSSIEFVDSKTAASSSTTTMSSPKLASQQLNAMLKSQLKSNSLSSTPASSVSSSSSCSPNSYSNQIELAEQTLMTAKKHTCLQQLPSVASKFNLTKQPQQQQKPVLVNLREVLQATHQLRTNAKNLDATKRELLCKLESTMKKRLDSSSSFGNLESLVELLNLNESSKSSVNLKNVMPQNQSQNTRSIKPNTAHEKSHQRLRSFRSSSPNKLFAETSKSMSGGAQDSFRKIYLAAENDSSATNKNNNKLESLKKNFNQRRNSIDLIPFNENDLKVRSNSIKSQSKVVKQSMSFQNYEKILDEKLITCTNNENVVPLKSLDDGGEEMGHQELNGTSSESSCNNWNYDELNELRMKFISLLSDSSKQDDDARQTSGGASHLVETKENLFEEKTNSCNVDMSKSQLLTNKSNQFLVVSTEFIYLLHLNIYL